MDLKFITENFRSFKRTELDGWGDPLNSLLEALFEDFLKLPYDVTPIQLMDRSRGSVYTLFDMPHGSEDRCELRVAVIDDKPLGVGYRFGDDTPWHTRVIDVGLFKSLAMELSIAAMENRLSKVTAETFPSLRSLDSSYLYFLGKKETMFAIRAPRDMCCFERLLSTYRGYFVDETGQAVALESIGRFVNKQQHGKGADDILVTIGGQERGVDGSQLMFELVAGHADLADALGSYEKTPCWVVEGVDARHKQANVLLRTPNRWSTASLTVAFDTDEDLQRFSDAHFDHDKSQSEQLVRSDFDLKAMGYAAQIISSD